MPGLGGRITSLLLGRRLANREQSQRRIGAFEGLPAMGLDGLGSSAYGPEAALTVLRAAPQLIKQRWYQYVLHLDRGRKLRSRLLRCGDPRLVVIDVPWMGVA